MNDRFIATDDDLPGIIFRDKDGNIIEPPTTTKGK